MLDPWLNRAVLGALHAAALGRAFLRYRNPRRQATGRHLVAFYERAWREAAERHGATLEVLAPGLCEVRRGEARVRVFENGCPIDDPVTQTIAGDKALSYRLLERAGLPTPRHAVFTFRTIDVAARFLSGSAVDCVVKPAAGTGGGRGVTTGIRTRGQLARAAAAAAVYGDELLVEEQFVGTNYRLLYLDGRLIDAFARRPPTAVADGRASVARLVRQANAARLRYGSGLSQVLLTVDLDMRRTLAKQGLSLRSVPREGTVVTLKTVVNENCGSDNTTATSELAPEVVEEGARAAGAVGVRLAGVDLITPDPTVPLSRAGGAVIEVNTPPNYYYHYHKRDGAFPVAPHVLEHLLNDPRSVPPGPRYTRAATGGDPPSGQLSVAAQLEGEVTYP